MNLPFGNDLSFALPHYHRSSHSAVFLVVSIRIARWLPSDYRKDLHPWSKWRWNGRMQWHSRMDRYALDPTWCGGNHDETMAVYHASSIFQSLHRPSPTDLFTKNDVPASTMTRAPRRTCGIARRASSKDNSRIRFVYSSLQDPSHL